MKKYLSLLGLISIAIFSSCSYQSQNTDETKITEDRKAFISFNVNFPSQITRLIHKDTQKINIRIMGYDENGYYTTIRSVNLTSENNSVNLEVPANQVLEAYVTAYDNENATISYKHFKIYLKPLEKRSLALYLPQGIWNVADGVKLQVGLFGNMYYEAENFYPISIMYSHGLSDYYGMIIENKENNNTFYITTWLDDMQVFNNDDINTYYFTSNIISSETDYTISPILGILHLTSGKTADILVFNSDNIKINVELSLPDGNKIDLPSLDVNSSLYYDSNYIEPYYYDYYDLFKFLNYDLFKNITYTIGNDMFINITYTYPYKVCVDKYSYYPTDIWSCYKGYGIFANATVHVEGYIYKTYANLTSIPLPWKESPKIANVTVSCNPDYSICNYTWEISNPYNHNMKCYLVSASNVWYSDISYAYPLYINGTNYYLQTPLEVNCSVGSFICDATKGCTNNFPIIFAVRDMELVEPLSDIKIIDKPNNISEENATLNITIE